MTRYFFLLVSCLSFAKDLSYRAKLVAFVDCNFSESHQSWERPKEGMYL